MKTILVITFSLFSIVAYSEGDWGKYIMKGKAFFSDSSLIKNDTLFFEVANKKYFVLTDKEGNYSTSIIWNTWDLDAGLFDENGNLFDIEVKNDEINPPVVIRYKSKVIKAQNLWKEEKAKPINERGQEKKVNLYF